MTRPDLDAIRARLEEYHEACRATSKSMELSSTSSSTPKACGAIVQRRIDAQDKLTLVIFGQAPNLLAYVEELEKEVDALRKTLSAYDP